MSKHRVFSGPNTGKYGSKKTPYFDAFHVVIASYTVLLIVSAKIFHTFRATRKVPIWRNKAEHQS